MDFKKELPDISWLSKIKFSIRLSILSTVLTLLLGISAVIIGINYFALDSILIASAENSLFQTSGRVAEQIRNYLQPLNNTIFTAHRMFTTGVADLQELEFTNFLYSLIVDNEDLVGAYWTGVNGDSYWVNRENKGFFVEIILHDKNRLNIIKKGCGV